MRQEARIGFQGWRMTSFTTYSSVRERVNAVIAMEIMGFSILLAGAFYLVSRRAQSRSNLFPVFVPLAMVRSQTRAFVPRYRN